MIFENPVICRQRLPKSTMPKWWKMYKQWSWISMCVSSRMDRSHVRAWSVRNAFPLKKMCIWEFPLLCWSTWLSRIIDCGLKPSLSVGLTSKLSLFLSFLQMLMSVQQVHVAMLSSALIWSMILPVNVNLDGREESAMKVSVHNHLIISIREDSLWVVISYLTKIMKWIIY